MKYCPACGSATFADVGEMGQRCRKCGFINIKNKRLMSNENRIGEES